MEHLRSTRAEINLDNLNYNIDRCREEIGIAHHVVKKLLGTHVS